jgi:hypothetical protein
MSRLPVLLCVLLIVSGCGLFGLGNKYSQGTFPQTPLNLGAINSADDDYNSTAPSAGGVMSLVFSSKRGGRTDFNFVREYLAYDFDLRTGAFSISNTPYSGLNAVQRQLPMGWAADAANSPANELGPYLLPYTDPASDYSGLHAGEYLMLFASDRSGDLDIYLTHNYRPASTSVAIGSKTFGVPVAVPGLNSPADDGYPTFDKTRQSVYFTSNRAGSFAIYRAALPVIAPDDMPNKLPGLTGVAVERVATLASAGDDKCPFIQGNRLVFTSNRPGGYGGYDLYYSQWSGDRWAAPVNFGPAVNSAYDEYRPILTDDMSFTNQLLIFSSNRPGGKGGFDLYLAGVPK